MARAVIFDLDGVLFDTEPLIAACMQAALKDSHLAEFSAVELAAAVGQVGSYRRMLSARELAAEAIDSVLAESQHRFKHAVKELLPLSGAAMLISEIRREGLRLGLASSARRELICALLAQSDLLKQFEVIVAYEDVENHKPHPMPYLIAAARLGVSLVDCVAIEDSSSGIASARAAGCKVIAVASQQHLTQDHSEADFRIQDLAQCSASWLKDL